MRFTTIRALVLPLAAALLLPACTTTPLKTGSYNCPAYRPTNPNNVRVKVSLQNRAVYVMEGDRPLLVTATAIGKPGNVTPTGNSRVTRKEATKRSYTYGFWVGANQIVPGKSSQSPGGGGWRYVGFPMAYWVEWMPAYGFHEGSVWPTPRTHGCLRLHKNVAPKFFALVQVGTPVSIQQTQPEDATIGKNVPRPTDYAAPDPPASVLISAAAFSAPSGPLLQ